MIKKEQKNNLSSSDILRKGGKLLKEYCPKCGGLLFKYQGRTICVNCDNINNIEEITENSKIDLSILIENLVSKKITIIVKRLDNEEDIIKQMNIADLLLKYIEILKKIQKGKTNDKDNKVVK